MKDFPRNFCYSIFVIFLAGCASRGSISDAKWHRDMINYSNNGQCAEALQAVESTTIEFTWKLMYKGTVHSVCFHDSEKYFAYFTLAARYGNKVAAQKS